MLHAAHLRLSLPPAWQVTAAEVTVQINGSVVALARL